MNPAPAAHSVIWLRSAKTVVGQLLIAFYISTINGNLGVTDRRPPPLHRMSIEHLGRGGEFSEPKPGNAARGHESMPALNWRNNKIINDPIDSVAIHDAGRIKQIALAAGFYRPARLLHRALIPSERVKFQGDSAFYRRFIHPGDLCFHIWGRYRI